MTDPIQFGPWTSFVDSTGQAPNMTRLEDERTIQFQMDRLELTIAGDSGPAAAAAVLSGGLDLTMPAQLDVAGLMLLVSGQITRTAGTQAQVTAALGSTVRSVEFPQLAPAGTPTGEAAEGLTPDQLRPTTDFTVVCFLIDQNPDAVGAPPFPPFPAVPITVSMHARCRFPDEAAVMNVSTMTVGVLLH